MLARVLLIAVALLLVVRALWQFLFGVVEGASRRPAARTGGAPPAKRVPMARDPVCGTFVVPGRALSLSDRGEVHYFCSESCRRAYRAGRRSMPEGGP